MTRGLARACAKKSRLYRSFCRLKTPQSKTQYTKYRNKLKSILSKAKIAYYHEQLRIRAGSMRLTWKLLNNLLNKGRKTIPVRSFMDGGV